MAQKEFMFWQKWLVWANVLTVVVGLLVAFAGNSQVFAYHNSFTSRIFFEEKIITGDTLAFKNWLFGIIGGTIVGFHVLMIFIAQNAFKNKEKWAYQAMWAGLLSWFLIDSGVSYYYGAIHNIVMINIVALTLIVIPLLMTRKEF